MAGEDLLHGHFGIVGAGFSQVHDDVVYVHGSPSFEESAYANSGIC